MAETAPPAASATTVVVSYPADLSDWGQFQVEKPSFRAYLKKTIDEVHVGDVHETFVGVGCCGNALDVPLRIESVSGGAALSAATTIEFEAREECSGAGGWRVQSAGGPTE
jgi:hypothetical protein